MTRPKIMTIIESPAEGLRMAPVVREFQQADDRFNHLLVSTGYDPEALRQALDAFDLEPDLDLGLHAAGRNAIDHTSHALARFARLITEQAPELVLVQGDSSAILSACLAAHYQRVAIGQIDAGVRTFDRDDPFPGEVNRRVISFMADVHFAPTERARSNLLQDGATAQTVFVTGSTSVDATRLLPLDPSLLEPSLQPIPQPGRHLLLVATQRADYHKSSIRGICQALNQLVEQFSALEVCYPIHPNPAVQDLVRQWLDTNERIHLIDPPTYPDLLRLAAHSAIILTDSIGLQEQAPALQTHLLLLRERTERPEVIESGWARLVGTTTQRIMGEAAQLLGELALGREPGSVYSPFGDGYSARRIVRILTELLVRAARIRRPQPAAHPRVLVPVVSPPSAFFGHGVRVRVAKSVPGSQCRSKRRFTFPRP